MAVRGTARRISIAVLSAVLLLPAGPGTVTSAAEAACVDGFDTVAVTTRILPEDVYAAGPTKAIVAGGASLTGGRRSARLVRYQGGRWTFRQFNHSSGRVEPLELSQPPDQQWLRMRDEIRRTLAFHGRALVKQLPALGQIQGGIVFAHPGASFEIELTPPFAWSDIPGWVRTIQQAPPVPGMNLRTQLQFLDLLLTRHQEVKPSERVVSMDQQAARIVGEARKRIEGWVRA